MSWSIPRCRSRLTSKRRNAPDEAARALKLVDHANQIRTHVAQLSSKSYWDACKPTPEFVVLFLPGEMFFSAALQHDAALIEDAAARKVILATPTTLIALLKAVSYGWRQEQLAENAEHISELGQELHERIATMASHLARLGGALGKAVEEFNNTARSMESRVLVSTRRFKELGVASKKEVEETRSHRGGATQAAACGERRRRARLSRLLNLGVRGRRRFELATFAAFLDPMLHLMTLAL